MTFVSEPPNEGSEGTNPEDMPERGAPVQKLWYQVDPMSGQVDRASFARPVRNDLNHWRVREINVPPGWALDTSPVEGVAYRNTFGQWLTAFELSDLLEKGKSWPIA
jgi:hypothetical protein